MTLALKVCAEPGCPTLVRNGRCPDHTRARDAARGRRQARGYDAAYDNERRHYANRMSKGERFTCWRCLRSVSPAAWTLGHCDDNRELIHGPEHPGCNYATSGRIGCPHVSHM